MSGISGAFAGLFGPIDAPLPLYSHDVHKPSSSPSRLLAIAAVVALTAAASLTLSDAQAQALPAEAADPSGAALDIGAALTEQVKQMALASTGGSEVETPGAPRVEILVGKLDPRLRLAPCQAIEPNLPPGTKLWGKTRIGLRCIQGVTKWNVYLPLTVKVFGRGLVANSSLTGNTALSPADFMEAEVDLASEPGAAITDSQLIAGRTLYGPMAAGQVLRQPLLKPRKFFEVGDTVTILASGPGFSAAVEGQAMTTGVEGIPARVKMENGKILSGAPIADHRMDVKL